MRLYLQWLRWDLRRFRVPLLIWVSLVAGFTGWLIWMHANQLTLPAQLPRTNEMIASGLGVIEFFLLLYILTTDPAEGTWPFWKVRPVSGWALAAVKLTVAVGWFALLPLLAHSVVRWVCVTGRPVAGWQGHSWAWMLWWSQCLAISVMALVCAGAKNASHALLRLAAGAAVLGVPVVISMMLGWEAKSAAARWMRDAFRFIYNGIFSLTPVTTWLFCGVILFMAARRTRTPSRMNRWTHVLLPVIALSTGGLLAESDRRVPPDVSLPPLPEEMVRGLKVGEPLLRGGTLRSSWTHYTGPPQETTGFYQYLHLEGLPQGYFASGRWLSLRITAPDGRTVSAKEGRQPVYQIPTNDPGQGILKVNDVSFPTEDLAPFSRTACRLEGTLRITVQSPHQAVMAIEAGQRATIGDTELLLREIGPQSSFHPSGLISISTVGRERYPAARFWMQHERVAEQILPLERGGASGVRGYFMERSRNDEALLPPGPGVGAYPLARAQVQEAIKTGQLDDWRLHVEWYQTVGAADLPVIVENVVIPRQPGDQRMAADVLRDLAVTPGMSGVEVWRIVRLTLSIVEAGIGKFWDTDIEPKVQAMSRVMNTVPREYLPMLLSLTKEEMWPMMSADPYDTPLRKRIAALMEPADVAALREEEPEIYRYLRDDLADRALITFSEWQDPPWSARPDDDLLREWKRAKFAADIDVNMLPLQTALERGLPWAVTELVDIAELLPDRHVNTLLVLMKISDCPRDPWEAAKWLRENSSRLAWDAAAKRWVLFKP